MKLLENKTVLITGASRGIGRCTALVMASEGADVIFTDLHEDENSNELVELLRSKGSQAAFFAADASSYEEAQELIQKIQQSYPHIDALVNNAGITADGLLLRMSPKDWDRVINVNLRSVYCMTKAVSPIMLRQRSGSIVNISSVVGVNGNAGQCNYAASKAGIIGFSKSVAKELGSRNIRCNAVAPGFIETPMTDALTEEQANSWFNQIPLHRFGCAEDVARTVLFLASDLSEYVTGQVICCDGGVSL